MHHVRNGQPREWSTFPTDAKEKELSIHFLSHVNESDYTISFRQYDVKLDWRVTLNGRQIGTLVTDEQDLISYLTVPRGTLHEGENDFLYQMQRIYSRRHTRWRNKDRSPAAEGSIIGCVNRHPGL